MQLLPQAAQAGQLVLGQPRFQRALLLDVLLQLDQRRQAGLEAGQALGILLGGGLGAAALGVGLGHAPFQGGQFGLRRLELVLAGQAIAGQLFQPLGVGRVQFAQFLLQALAALLQRLQLAVGVALGLGHQGQVLFDARQRGAHVVAPGRGVAHPGFDGRQAGLGVLGRGALPRCAPRRWPGLPRPGRSVRYSAPAGCSTRRSGPAAVRGAPAGGCANRPHGGFRPPGG